VPEDTVLEEVWRLRAELERERELRVAAEALAAEREIALANAPTGSATESRRRSRRLTPHKLQGNWLPGTRRY
jgi:hypothetical protein